ncbi:MAG: efflux RND transporter periplasmic adaptor subunit, partial [Alistipes sp.]|nr:efflux RND transporter periplasmic adaptor subunit [Alistipes sp.]
MDKRFVINLGLSLLLMGCHQKPKADKMPLLTVTTTEAVAAEITPEREFIGYLQSNFDAVIQPRVNGFLTSKRFSNGMPVKRGALLYTIDKSQFSASMLASEASLQSARAKAVEARNNYERAVPLAEMNAISRAQLDQYTATFKASEAAVKSAEQALKNARLDLSYTDIRSPIDGIAGGSNAHIGDYVGPGTEFSVL